MAETKYGFVGWKEFLESRKEILNSFDRAKGRNRSRPVRTEHGVTGEAAFRKWLGGVMPKRFGVTSGYVIPAVISTGAYKLLHYDVIIYDSLSAPILWVDGGDDISEQGKSRAIPAEHVRAIYEVKSSFTNQSIRKATQKLAELDELKTFLVNPFHSGIVFFDIANSVVKNTNLLRGLLPARNLVGYFGGMIMRSNLNEEMTGVFRPLRNSQQNKSSQECLVPLAKDLESVAIHLNSEGQPVLAEKAAGITCFSDGHRWHFSKNYGPTLYGEEGLLNLSWSYSGFARFTVDLLAVLEGKPPYESGMHFAQVFDQIGPP